MSQNSSCKTCKQVYVEHEDANLEFDGTSVGGQRLDSEDPNMTIILDDSMCDHGFGHLLL